MKYKIQNRYAEIGKSFWTLISSYFVLIRVIFHFANTNIWNFIYPWIFRKGYQEKKTMRKINVWKRFP